MAKKRVTLKKPISFLLIIIFSFLAVLFTITYFPSGYLKPPTLGALFTTPSGGNVVWNATFENGDCYPEINNFGRDFHEKVGNTENSPYVDVTWPSTQVHSGNYAEREHTVKDPSCTVTGCSHRGYCFQSWRSTNGAPIATPVLVTAWIYLEKYDTSDWTSYFTLISTPTSESPPGSIMTLDANTKRELQIFYRQQVQVSTAHYLYQTNPIPIPLNKWVKLQVYVDWNGPNSVFRVWQDDQLIIDATGDFGPKSTLEKGHFGLYAGPNLNEIIMYNDDLSVEQFSGGGTTTTTTTPGGSTTTTTSGGTTTTTTLPSGGNVVWNATFENGDCYPEINNFGRDFHEKVGNTENSPYVDVTWPSTQVHSGNYAEREHTVTDPSCTTKGCSHRGYCFQSWRSTNGAPIQTPVNVTAWIYIEKFDMNPSSTDTWSSYMTLISTNSSSTPKGSILTLDANSQLQLHVWYNPSDQIGTPHTIEQTISPKVPLPKNQWVKLEVYLDWNGPNGVVKVWQNGQLIVDAERVNLGEKSTLEKGHFGLYTGSGVNELTMYTDDLSVMQFSGGGTTTTTTLAGTTTTTQGGEGGEGGEGGTTTTTLHGTTTTTTTTHSTTTTQTTEEMTTTTSPTETPTEISWDTILMVAVAIAVIVGVAAVLIYWRGKSASDQFAALKKKWSRR